MFKIKICGLTTPAEAKLAVTLGADMIGLNFYAKSPRYVTLEQAAAIASVVPKSTGVFVNATADEINRIARAVSLDVVQLHGDEPPQLLADIDPALPIVRVHSLGKLGMQAIADDLQTCCKVGRAPAAVLVDATVPGEYGGTGKTVDWQSLVNHDKLLDGLPLILAGGLTDANLAEAIRVVRPDAVDTASGVESAPAVKDEAKMRSFIQAAKLAFETLQPDVE